MLSKPLCQPGDVAFGRGHVVRVGYVGHSPCFRSETRQYQLREATENAPGFGDAVGASQREAWMDH